MALVHRFHFFCALSWFITLASGCRNQETLAPVVFSEQEETSTSSVPELAPPWKTANSSILQNGALIQWIIEPKQSAFHFRLIFPTAIHGDRIDAAAAATVLRTLERTLERKIQGLRGRVTSRVEVGRIELAVYCPQHHAGQVLQQLGRIFRDRKISRRLLQTQGKFVATLQEDPIDHAVASLNAIRLNQPISREYASRANFVSLSKSKLERAWSLLLDPRDAIVIVHTGQPLMSYKTDLDDLSQSWQGRAWLRNREDEFWTRLWGSRPPTTNKRKTSPSPLNKTPLLIADLLETPPSSSTLTAAESPLTVVLQRAVPITNSKDRGLAHLSYRLLQEEFTLTFAISRNVALFNLNLELDPKEPNNALQEELERFDFFLATLHDRHRLSQATRLWIGALLTRSSLNGEDWTELWSESINLADSAKQLPRALTNHATVMFAIEPEVLQKWQKQWLSPKHGTPGWNWSLVGSNPSQQKDLQHLIDPS